MRRSLAYLPTPFVASVTLPGERDHRVVAVVDLQPVTLPSFESDEAPVAFTVLDDASGRRRDYRLADGRLWAALGEGGGWTLDEAPGRIVDGVGRRISGHDPETDREQGFLDALVVGGALAQATMSLHDHVLDPPHASREDAWTALKHVENHMAVVDGRLHHEVPEPTFQMDDPADGGTSVDVVERRWEDVNGAELLAFPGPGGRSWLTYPVHHGPLVSQVAAALAGAAGRSGDVVAARRRVLFHDPVVEARGVPGHVVNGYKVARAESVVGVAADVIGHATDEGMFAYVELRRALADVGGERSVRGLSGVDPERMERLTVAMRRLHEVLSPWSKGGPGTLAYRAAMISSHRDRYEERLARTIA